MPLNDLLEKLKGSAQGREGGNLGLFVTPDALYLAEASSTGPGRMTLGKSLRVAVPSKPGETTRMGTLNTDFLGDGARIVELLKPALAQGGFRSKRLVVTLSPHFGLVRYFVMPTVDRRFWKQSVPLEAKKYVPFPLGELRYDFQVFPVTPGIDGRPRMGILFAVSPQKNLDSLAFIAQALGLELGAVELSPYSAGRFAAAAALNGHGGASATAQVHLDKQAAYILLHQAGIPLISREVHWVGELQDRRRIDLQGSVEFARKQLGVQDIKVILTGTAELGSWAKSIEEETGLQPEIGDLAKAASITEPPEWPLLASAGASLRSDAPESVVVDISQAYQKLHEDPRVYRAIAAVAGTLAGLLLIVSLFQQWQVLNLQRTLGGLKRKTSGITAFQGLQSGEIEKLVSKVRLESQSFEEALGPRDYATAWYSELPGALPAEVWIQTLAYEAPIGERGGARSSLQLGGFAFGPDRNADVQFSNNFRDNLKKQKEFPKSFKECDLSFATGRASEKEPHKRTAFTLFCEKKGLLAGGAR